TVLLGPAWIEAAGALRVLVFGALLRSVIDIAPPILRALGYTRADFRLKFVQVGLMAVLLYPAARAYGIVGVSFAVVLAALLTIPFWVVVLRRAAKFTADDFITPAIA